MRCELQETVGRYHAGRAQRRHIKLIAVEAPWDSRIVNGPDHMREALLASRAVRSGPCGRKVGNWWGGIKYALQGLGGSGPGRECRMLTRMSSVCHGGKLHLFSCCG